MCSLQEHIEREIRAREAELEFVDIADRRYGFRPVATQEQLIDANLRWQETRDALIQELRPQPNKTRLTNPIRAWIGRAKTKSELKKFTERGTPQ